MPNFLTVFDEFGQDVASVNVEHDQCAQRDAILLRQLSSDQCNDRIDLLIAHLQIAVKRLKDTKTLQTFFSIKGSP